MKRSIISLVALCFVLGLSAQNKKLIVGNWLADKVLMDGQVLFSRQDKAAVFAAYKKLAFGDSTTLSLIDSLALVETVQEADKAFASLSIGFDAKGNHTASSYDSKTKKAQVSKGVYKFGKGDDTQLLVKMTGGNTFDRSTIVELTATTLTLTEESDDNEGQPMLMTFVRKPVRFQKPKK